MAATTDTREEILRVCETRMAALVFLVFARGDRQEAAAAAAEGDRAVTDLLRARPGKIRRKAAQGVWDPAADTLGFRSWLWFVIAALLGVVPALVAPGSTTAERYARIAFSLVVAVPSALFVSRQSGHVLVQRALRAETAGRRSLVWIGRWLGEGAVLVLTLGMWVLWMRILVL
ncbi:hypothetical protein OHB54_30580 [Streptomyces sp. NBC_01007]|nr:hypothetical protein OHB54_30580 [Streptomyces sp. NBC_01007]